ncbi:type I membrane glycoproteins cell-cell fusogen domain-containing protein [Ditylenchus destructor]|nr:type I membrane glycoproteins cell-cell fusogen domain-containing protein [Ditylenchus destructor]
MVLNRAISVSILLTFVLKYVNTSISFESHRTSAELPHCTRTLLMEGKVEESDDNNSGQNSGEYSQQLNMSSHSQFFLSLKETTCMTLQSNNSFTIMHTIEYLRLEHHYAITGKYKFAIPVISQQCKCDCAYGDSICTIENYHYRNCTSGAVCYRTYRPFQSSAGCLSTPKSELCCQIQIDPYKDWGFQAIRLKQPDTILVLHYRIYERAQSGAARRNWKMTVDKIIKVQLNRGLAKFELNEVHRIQLMAGGSRPNRQVEPGIYFWQIGTDRQRLRGGVPVNDLSETDLNKLGWFRWEQGKWNVRKGLEKITQAQHVNVNDCKSQKYTSTFNAEQFVLRSDDDDIMSFDLGASILDDAWVAGIEIEDRYVKIEHAEGAALILAITTQSTPRIVHHVSQFTNFNGSIQVDSESNRYLNLTFVDARGTLIGQVFSSDSKTTMDTIFSVQTSDAVQPEFRAIVAVDSTIRSQKLVCVYPAGDFDGQICHWLNYVETALQEYTVTNRWQSGHYDCVGCNERGFDAVWSSIDPRNWLDGLNSPTEFFTCILEIVLCIAAILLAIVTFTKCIIPLFRCLRSISRPPKKK